jgi:lipopolysaccharide biosynthesis glycosyltransferase
MINQKIFISICYHKPMPIIRTKYMVPVHVGRALAHECLSDVIGDDTGDNISKKNTTWSELTGLYWMWKNVDAEYYGLMHYRRLLNFAGPSNGRVRRFTGVGPKQYARFGWTDTQIDDLCTSNDIITGPLWSVHPAGAPHINMSSYAMYAREHYAADMDVIERIISKDTPNIFPFFIQMLTERQAFFSHIAIFRREIFHDYCKWLFSILEAAEKQIDISHYDRYQRRVWGFIAERLVNAYVSYARHVLEARVCRRPLVIGSIPPVPVSTEEVMKAITHQTNSACYAITQTVCSAQINVVLAIDDTYSPHAAVTILSAIRASVNSCQLKFFILEGGNLSQLSKDRLSAVAHENGSNVEFITIDGAALTWLPLNRDHISIATYYRLIMHKALSDDIKKIIYIDADTIVVDSLVKLWSIDIRGKPIGACPDEGGVLQSRRLRLPVTHTYCNAGVIVFDLEHLRKIDMFERVLVTFRKYADFITLQDQDILNIVFCNNTFVLPLRWNVNSRIFMPNELEPAYTMSQALEAARSPGIIHFTDRRKPWTKNCKHPLRNLYWEYRNDTPWREDVMHRSARQLKCWGKRRLGKID